MKRRLIFGLVAVVLALNLILGATVYLGSARAMEQKDSADANLDMFANVMEKVLQEGHWIEAMACYRKTLSISPGVAEAWAGLGMACFQNGQIKEAEETWQKALDINPAQPQVQNNLASVLATASDPSLRNGAKAVALAEQANQLTGGGNPNMLCTLAEAYAEAGRFDDASAAARKALSQAQAQKDDKLAGALQEQLKLYAAGSPVRRPK